MQAIARVNRVFKDKEGGLVVDYVVEDLPLDEYLELWSRAHVVVLPSMWEGVGFTFLEAIAGCKPIITVDAPPMNSYVLNRTGWLCKVKEFRRFERVNISGAVADVEDLSRLLVEACRDRERISAYSRNTTELRDMKSLEGSVDRLKQIFLGD